MQESQLLCGIILDKKINKSQNFFDRFFIPKKPTKPKIKPRFFTIFLQHISENNLTLIKNSILHLILINDMISVNNILNGKQNNRNSIMKKRHKVRSKEENIYKHKKT